MFFYYFFHLSGWLFRNNSGYLPQIWYTAKIPLESDTFLILQHVSCTALILRPEEVLMTLWLLLSSHLNLLLSASLTFFYFQYTLEESKHFTLLAHAQFPDSHNVFEEQEESTVSAPLWHIFEMLYLTDFSCPHADEWRPFGQLTPARWGINF